MLEGRKDPINLYYFFLLTSDLRDIFLGGSLVFGIYFFSVIDRQKCKTTSLKILDVWTLKKDSKILLVFLGKEPFIEK